MKQRTIFLTSLFFIGFAITAYSQDQFQNFALLDQALAIGEVNFDRDFKYNLVKKSTIPDQDSLKTVLVVTVDNNEFVGQLIEETSEYVKIKTQSYGILTIQKVRIKTMKDVVNADIRSGVLWKQYMQSTRYFWQPNGYGLKKGEAYYQNVWVFFNQVSVGVTDNFLLGGGIIPVFFFNGAPTPVWITPKVSIPIVQDKVNLGVGGLFATVIGAEGANLGILYSSATFGPRDRNFTFGVGYGYAGGDWANRPTFSANFLSRVGARGYFIMENYIIEVDRRYAVLSIIGGRSIFGNGVGLDYGLVIPFFPDMDFFVAVPWLGITIPIGKKNQG